MAPPASPRYCPVRIPGATGLWCDAAPILTILPDPTDKDPDTVPPSETVSVPVPPERPSCKPAVSQVEFGPVTVAAPTTRLVEALRLLSTLPPLLTSSVPVPEAPI